MSTSAVLSDSSPRHRYGRRSALKKSAQSDFDEPEDSHSQDQEGQRSSSVCPAPGIPRMAQLETLEAKMASIEVSLSMTPRRRKSSLLGRCAPLPPHPPAPPAHSPHPDPVDPLRAHLKDKEHMIQSLKEQLCSRPPTGSGGGGGGGAMQPPLTEAERRGAETRIGRLRGDMEAKRAAIKGLKGALEKLDITDNIDVRIQQAELEYQLGREELELLTLLEQSRALQLLLEQDDNAKTKQDQQTIYSGSAMSTSSLCEYCYCISGEQRCVRPRCLLPLAGCRPRRSPHSCCPVRYDCQYDQTTTTTLAPSEIKGCEMNGVFFPEGEKVVDSSRSPCDNCFCMRGAVRCVPLSCAPPLLGCTPIVLPGKCCASSYNCSQKLSETNKRSDILLASESGRKKIEAEVVVNERSFPDDTLLTPSQIASLLLNADGRINRRIGIEKSTDEKSNSTSNVESSSSTTTEKLTTIKTANKGDIVSTTDLIQPTEATTVISSVEIVEPVSTFPNNKTVTTSTETLIKVENITEPVVVGNNNNEDTKTDVKQDKDQKIDVTSSKVNSTTESHFDASKMMLNDTVNCTTELSSIDAIENTTEYQTEDDLVTASKYNDTEERSPYISDLINALTNSKEELSERTDSETENNKDNDISSVASQFPSTSLIIPKDDDVFMVNVSTFVRTNTSVVTLRPVAVIPPDVEAFLNITMNKNNQKDDYFDYDYKSSLPPSLPNLEIIPFLAIDAVDKVKDQNHYESKNYITSDTFNPTTFAPYTEEKYISNPTSYPIPIRSNNNFPRNPVYKQHISDKFQATTYATIVDDKYGNHQYASDKYDATVYPSLTVKDMQTETPSFNFDINSMNLFSPPSKTEGGFLPKDPPLISPYYDLGYPSSEEDMSATGSSLMVTNHAKTNSDDCTSNGRKYKNGELITESSACVVCFCYYGDIHCQDPECPAIKPGCRRIIEKDALSCCGIEICNDDSTAATSQTSAPSVETVIVPTTNPPIASINRINTKDPFKDVIRTEAAPNLESLIDDMIPHYVIKTTVATSTTSEEPTGPESTFTKIPTYVIPSNKDVKGPTVSTSTTTTEPTTFTTQKIIPPEMYTPDPNNYKGNNKVMKLDSTTDAVTTSKYTTTTTDVPETTFSEAEEFPEEEEEEEFSFGSVLKLLLGDSSETETKPTTIRTTRSYATPSTQASSSWQPSTPYSTRPVITSTQPTTVRTTATQPATYRNTYKYPFTKPIRPVSAVSLLQKNFSKPIVTTRSPSVYPTINRFTKPRHPYNSTPLPMTTEPVKNIAPPVLPNETISYKRKPAVDAPTESAFAFGAGLLKLAGCNIYGRMYRVGKIITELSGPCLECMCTEVGVQCRAISC